MRLILLTSLLVLAFGAQARCRVPVAVDGHTFVNAIDERYSPLNPNAGNVVKVGFKSDTYTLEILHLGKIVSGTYQYKVLADNVGQLAMREDFDGQTTDYTVTLVCLAERTGTLVTTQWQGAIKPDVRQNVGRYNFVE